MMQTARSGMLHLLIALIIAGIGVVAPAPAQAQISSAGELIRAVNDLRASYELEPYTVDRELMDIAQAHSDYQASIKTLTHTRADGSGPGDQGITAENIGGGYNASVADVMAQWTDDYWHLNTLIGYDAGLVGAGVAVKDGVVYYTLDVIRTGENSGLMKTVTPGQQPTQLTPQEGTLESTTSAPATVVPVYTVTPRQNGAIIHVVGAGQTLWAIALAYQTRVDTLIALNGLSATEPVIYAGQKLLVRPAFTATVTPTFTETPLPPTETRRPTQTLRPLRPTRTMAPSRTATIRPLTEGLHQLSGRTVAIIVVLVIGLGLLLVVTFIQRVK